MEIIDSFSVERLPGVNKSVMFSEPLKEVFRDSDVWTATTRDGHEYVSWGANNQLPYRIIDLIEEDETLATCMVFNAELCYGSGLEYCTEGASPRTVSAVEKFVDENALPQFFLGAAQDMKYFNFAVSVIVLSRDGRSVVELHRKPACYCRFAPVDPKTGRIPYVVFGPFRNTQPDNTFERIELLDTRAPLRDLRRRVADSSVRKFAVLSVFPGVDSLYYPIPHYAALFKGPWYRIKQLIGTNKKAKLSNSAPIKYIVEISPRYWEKVFKDNQAFSAEAQQKLMARRKQQIIEFLTNAENAGATLFTGKSLSLDGKSENPDITVTSVDSKNKEGGDWESDIAEAVNMECFTMRVHSNLVGSVPGKAQTNNSGSDKRELFTIAQALQKPYRDILFGVHKLIIAYNGWTGVHPVCPFMQLTTLDEHTDAKEVTL